MSRTCHSCKQEFVVATEDFDFYKKVNVPPPTWCPECRMVRRMMWRNERALYKRKCGLCGEGTLTVYHPDDPFVVYCVSCWWSDGWSPMEYAREYDFSKPFFEQYQELFRSVPRQALHQKDAKDSTFANYLEGVKNVYLSYSVIWNSEDVYYSKNIDESTWIFDCLDVASSERCYESVGISRNFNCTFAYFSKECIDCDFVYDCVNCRNCLLCMNLRNKEYCVRNRECSKEEYEKERNRLRSGSFRELKSMKDEFARMRFDAVNKYTRIINCRDCTGDDLRDCKNAKETFLAYEIEDAKYVFRSVRLKGAMDTINAGGKGTEMFYEFINGGGGGGQYVRFCTYGLPATHNVHYVDHCGSSSDLFGCIGLRNKKHCILNKQYSEEEYEELLSRIIEHMSEVPYTDSQGREYKYGEFFPPELSPFAYNETIAQEYFPITKEKALEQGFRWREPEKRDYGITVKADDFPDGIGDIDDSIKQQIIGCAHKGVCNEQCTTAFRIDPQELQYCRQMNLPLPRLCPNCRHYERLGLRNSIRLWHRQCMCDYKTHKNTTKHQHHPEGRCPNEFETSYSPERTEIVYCEECYQAEVI